MITDHTLLQRNSVTDNASGMARVPRIVGGMFGLETSAPGAVRRTPPFLHGEDHWLVNARSCLRLLADQLQPPRVWLPAFICPDVIHAFGTLKSIQFYDRGTTAWLDQLSAGDLVIVLDEFGFLADRKVIDKARERGAIVVEDAAQALLTKGVGEGADYLITSPRKFVGVVDGGILSRRLGPALPPATLEPPPTDWLALAQQAASDRARFDRDGRDRGWFTLFQQVEASQPVEPCAISAESRAILTGAIDWAEIAERRRNNYRELLKYLGAWALYDRLPDEVTPLGFPIVLTDRDRVRNALFAADIFPPIHWPLGADVPREYTAAHRLASRIMTLPCDQRYDAAVMRRMADIVLGEVRP